MQGKFDLGAPMAAALTGVVTLFTALLSALVAWLTSRRTVRLELDKARLEAQASAIQRLIEKRLEVYPGLYREISVLAAEMRAESTNLAALQGVRSRVDTWDAEHAVVLGPDATNHCYAFRYQLRRYIKWWESDDAEELLRTRSDLLKRAEELELALRADLGIYGIRLRRRDGTYELPVPRDYFAHAEERTSPK